MSERTRREYLKDFGIAAGVVGAAGCLGGGEDEETPTNTTTDTPGTTSSDPTTEENTTEGEETTEEETGNSHDESVPEVMDFVPTADEINSSEYDGETPVTAIGVGFPSQIAGNISNQIQQGYEERGTFIPYDFADVDMSQVEQEVVADIKGVDWIPIWKFNEDISQSLNSEMEKRGEYEGFDILYLEDAEQPFSDDTIDRLVLTDGEYAMSVTMPGDEERFYNTLKTLVDASEGEANRFVDETSLGQALTEIDYKDATEIGSEGWEDVVAGGARYVFGEDELQMERIELSEDGDVSVTATENYDPGKYAGQL
ncbi:hypothetical protein [Halapricum desulfuricans]|uniref:Uncharacterized protein n=1 Tax=Halapricum desulfuricans TaxID=2841257 RepID=A0A897N3I3_9EURY|nr:hypothetical protein [Halapricum desulfuricans]QSG08950.1 hypothetical protein HSR122_1559 [Halapricum desulfuricans]